MPTSLVNRVKKNPKAAAATAAGSFFLANPLIATFLVGVGTMLYFSLRQNHRGRRFFS